MRRATVATIIRCVALTLALSPPLVTQPAVGNRAARGGIVRASRDPRPDSPDEALRFRQLQWRDENGVIPDGALLAAKQQMELTRLYSEPGVAGISPSKWQWLGPGNIGGRVRAIVINPSNSAVWFAGSVGGGIWRTDTAGASWQPVNDFMANLAVSTIVIQPGNSNVMYAGTGEGFYNADGIRGAGIFKSTDGGVIWSQLPF